MPIAGPEFNFVGNCDTRDDNIIKRHRQTAMFQLSQCHPDNIPDPFVRQQLGKRVEEFDEVRTVCFRLPMKDFGTDCSANRQIICFKSRLKPWILRPHEIDEDIRVDEDHFKASALTCPRAISHSN
jgi:hypothetical protein